MQENILEKSFGGVTVRAWQEVDECPDYSYIGEFCNFAWPKEGEVLYNLREDCFLLPSSELWRDRLGRITREPEDSPYSREYQYAMLQAEELKQARYQADYMNKLAGGEGFIGVVAEVELDGRAIGSGGLFGIETWSDSNYITEVAREVMHEAIHDARAWLNRRIAA